MSGAPFIRIHDEWGISAPGANTDAITDETIAGDGTLRVWVSVATSTVVNLMVTPSGGSEQTVPLNGNVALDGGGVYDVPIHDGAVVNIQVETDSALHYVVMDLVKNGAS